MKNFFKIFSVAISVAIISTALYTVTHTRDVLDWVALRNYQAPSEVVVLADVTSMNDSTRKVFYVNHPELQNKPDFKNSCVDQEQTIVLGCYVEAKGIFLLEVDDPRLQGIIEVTAAHEVLHAMYDRLSDEERAKVDKMTTDFFAGLDDERISKNIENYRKRDPNVVPNELHSILATEVRNLTPELEQYYSKYFNDRKAIVTFSEKYEQTFVELEEKVAVYKKQLDNLKAKLDQNEKQINQDGEQIEKERARLDSLLKSNQVDEYNNAVPGFNGLVNSYNQLIGQRKVMVEEYNRIVVLYNEVATTEAELVESLKSTTSEIEDKPIN